MSKMQEAAAAASRAAPLAALLLGCSVVYCIRNQMSSTLPTGAAYSCFGSLYELLAGLGSPAQWMVALLGLCLYPALSRTSRVACSPTAEEAAGSSAPSTREASSRPPGLGSHCIQLERDKGSRAQTRGGGSGFFKRLRRLLSEGRAQARQLCGRNASVQSAMSGLARKRSFGSRSSKSEDVLSSRLSTDSILRGAQQNAGGGGGGRRGLLQRKGSAGGGGSRWQPSMSRIASGQHLAAMAPSDSSCSSVTAGKRLEILSYNGFQAVDCISNEMTDPAFQGVRQVVTDTHLLQFGAMIGEASAELALSQAGSPGAVGPEPTSLFGPYDRPEAYRQGWELIVEEHKPGLHYWTWRRHLRKGLFMYKSKTVYETATTAQIVDFTYDTEFRRTWDESMAGQLAIPPPPSAAAAPPTSSSPPSCSSPDSSLSAVGTAAPTAAASGSGGVSAVMSLAEADAKSAGGKSAFMYARTKFPPPMASREYTYVRRCWAKPDDGGCYCISRAYAHPSPPQAGGRTVRVHDFISGYVIRSSKGVYDTANPAVEVVNVYFEDPCMPSGIINMGIRRALWPMVQKAEAAFRDFLLTKVHGNLEQPPPPRAVALDSLGAAVGVEGAQAARAVAADADAASCMGGLAPAGHRRWRLAVASPYVLLYRSYVAAWRGGRGAMLSLLSGLMSLWCGSTGLCVGLMAAAKSGMGAVATAAQAFAATAGKRWTSAMAAAATAVGLAADGKGGGRGSVIAAVLWPWEALAPLVGLTAGAGIRGSGHVSLPRTPSTSSTSGDRLSSHPLPGRAVSGPKRLSFAPQVSSCTAAAAGGVAESPRAPRRARGGFARRCALLAVKVAKVAGAGLLLGRAARGTDAAVEATCPQGKACPQQPQQQQPPSSQAGAASGPGPNQPQGRRLLPTASRRSFFR